MCFLSGLSASGVEAHRVTKVKQQNKCERLLPLRAVLERTSHSRAGLYDAMTKGEFPRPIKISANRVAWPESAIADWISAKISEAA